MVTYWKQLQISNLKNSFVVDELLKNLAAKSHVLCTRKTILSSSVDTAAHFPNGSASGQLTSVIHAIAWQETIKSRNVQVSTNVDSKCLIQITAKNLHWVAECADMESSKSFNQF